MKIKAIVSITVLSFVTLTFQNCGQFEPGLAQAAQSNTQLASNNQTNNHANNPPAAQMVRKPTADWTKSEIEFNTYGAYSQDMIGAERIWFGGWISQADPFNYLTEMTKGTDPTTVFGPDKIFVADRKLEVSQTQASVRLALQLKGYHINDPTVVAPQSTDGIDRSQWLYMYFTMLDNRLAENCRRKTSDILQCPELFAGHDIGMASSIDGGLSWTFRGIVVEASKSGDGAGAWMPSVVKIGNEIHLYYNTGKAEYSTANLFRVRLNANGVEKIASPEAVVIPGFQKNDQIHNVDIQTASIQGKRVYLMVSNNGRHDEIRAHFSADGLTFQELSSGPLLSSSGSTARLITPHIENFGENTLSAPLALSQSKGGFSFARIQFTRYGGVTTNEMRRQSSITFTVPQAIIDAAEAF